MNYRRDRVIKERLDNTNKELCKDGLIFTGCAAVIVASVYGTISLSRELLDFY